MKYLIISDYKDSKKEPKIEGLILLDAFSRCYYTYDCSERNLHKINRPIKKSAFCNSPKFDFYLSYSEKILLDDKIFNEIINLKIKQVHSFTLKDFFKKYEMYEFLI